MVLTRPSLTRWSLGGKVKVGAVSHLADIVSWPNAKSSIDRGVMTQHQRAVSTTRLNREVHTKKPLAAATKFQNLSSPNVKLWEIIKVRIFVTFVSL